MDQSIPFLKGKIYPKKSYENLNWISVVSAHLRNKANIFLNNLFSSLLVLDITYQGTQMKCATLHFVSTQTNRLGISL